MAMLCRRLNEVHLSCAPCPAEPVASPAIGMPWLSVQHCFTGVSQAGRPQAELLHCMGGQRAVHLPIMRPAQSDARRGVSQIPAQEPKQLVQSRAGSILCNGEQHVRRFSSVADDLTPGRRHWAAA